MAFSASRAQRVVNDDTGASRHHRHQQQHQTDSTSSTPNYKHAVTNPLPLLSLRTRDLTAEVAYYMPVWQTRCIPAIHSSFRQLDAWDTRQPVPRALMVSLAACRLSRISPRPNSPAQSGTVDRLFHPNEADEQFSMELYGGLMRRIGEWRHDDLKAHPQLALSVIVLFCYLESSMGSFGNLNVHSQAAETLIQNNLEHLALHAPGLLAAWIEIRMQTWWRRAYFGTPEYFQDHLGPIASISMGAIENTRHTRRAMILSILCDAHRCYTASTIAAFANISTTNKSKLTPTNHPKFSKQLDVWHQSLTLQELPRSPEPDNLPTLSGTSELHIQPLKFESHVFAMNFAYYAMARLFTCRVESNQGRQGSPESQHDTLDQTDAEDCVAWGQLLLQIAAGLNWEDCLSCNTYTIGIANLLLACTIYSHSFAIGQWAQQCLVGQLTPDSLEEGNFPLFQILEAIKFINTERMAGQDIFGLFQAVNDSGGGGKRGSYRSQKIDSVLVYARCIITGQPSIYHRCF